MTQEAPAGATCAVHRGAPASFACPRCGDFACAQCSFRAHPQSPAMCSTCWSKRSEKVQELTKDERLHRPTVALWLGVASLIPGFWPAQLAGLILSIVCLVKVSSDPQRLGRGRALAGLILSAIGSLGTLVLLLAIVFGK